MQLLRVVTGLRGISPNSVTCLLRLRYRVHTPPGLSLTHTHTRTHTHREPRAHAQQQQQRWRSILRRCFSSRSSSSADGDLIYTGSLAKAVLGVKFFSYSSSMLSVCLMPYILSSVGAGSGSAVLQVALCGVLGFFTFLTPVLLHVLTRAYVVRLYHRGETDVYTAVTYGVLLQEKRTVFHQRDVNVPDTSRIFTSFYANKRPMLVNPDLFPLPQDYNHLMGYDRPFSFSPDPDDWPKKN